MRVQELIARLAGAGVQVRRDADRLVLSGRTEGLDAALLAELRDQKEAVMAVVESVDGEARPPRFRITPDMLPLVELTQEEIERVVAGVEGGAANVQDIYPLAPLQDGILFHHLMAREGDPYLSGFLISFDTRDGLDRYLAALQAVVDRHDILRTAVIWEGLREPVQVVWRRAPLQVEEVELDPAGGDAAEQLYARFDPRHHRIDLRRAPMIRAHVARDEPGGRWLFYYLRHHFVMDHTTVEVWWREIAAHLAGRADTLPKPLPFRNYVAQTRLGVSRDEHREFFTGLLGDVDEPTAPFGVLDVRGEGAAMAEARLPVSDRLAARLRERTRALGVSAASVFHVAWAQVLARASGRDDVVFGTVLFGRMHGGEGSDRVMGPFINTLPIRIRVGGAGVEESVRQTHALLARLMRHEHASLALAQRCSGVGARSPLFTSLLNYRHSARKPPADASAAPAARGGMKLLRGEERTNYPLALSVDDLGDGFRLKAQVLYDALDPARVCAFVHTALEGLVEALERSPERGVGTIDVLPAEERARVVEEWNRTEAFPSGSCIHELFERQVERTPGADAVTFGGERLTYGELNARANRLAHHLRSLGVGPDVRVAICVDRSLEMVVAVVAVLKAGGGYVPLDPAYPEERLAFMLADSAPAAVLTQRSLRDRVGAAGVAVLELDDASPWAGRPDTNPPLGGLRPGHLAYVIYTSGSTGRPKGVLVPHRNVARLFAATDRWFGFGEGDVWTLFHSFAFDFSVWEIWGALLHGGRLVVVPGEVTRSPEAFHRLVCDEGVTVLNQTPSAFQPFIHAASTEDAEHSLRLVIFGGEALDVAMLRPWFERNGDESPRVVNMYGITETTVHVTYRPLAWDDVHRAEAERGGASPIGQRIPDLGAYLLDASGEPVPVGVPGELYVGGAGVARGYLGRPGLTAERFVADPFGGEPGARLYRTGDLGRWRPDGTLEFLGRVDRQVKVRGFRIELGEIEARLAEHPGVREAVVLAREDAPGEKRLVAYLLGDEAAGADLLRAHLGETLPAYMVPAAYVRVERWPLTPNGKLDRKALPAPEGEAFAAQEYEAPAGETEQALAEIWAEVLGLERVGRWDDFFELGGHSLLAVQVISRVQQVLEVEIELGQLFTWPVLRDLARELETAARAELPPIEPAPRDGAIPLSFAQARLWFLEQLGNLGSTYNIRRRKRLRGDLDRGALVRALDAIVARHEALRTVFGESGGVPEQRIAPVDAVFHLVEHDLRGVPGADAELGRLMVAEARTPFDLERGPLIRGRLVQMADDDHVLLVTMHHIVSDAWSTGLFFSELSTLYAAYREGREAGLPALPVQYADYAVWQREWVEGDVLREQAEYWTRTLSGAPELLELPTDHPRPAQMDHAGARFTVRLDAELTAGLKALGRRHGTTLFMTLLAGWATVLSRLSGQADVVIGTPTAGRGRREIEELIGFFVHTLAMRVDLSGAPTAAELLGQVKKRVLEAQHHQDIPFEQVVERVDPARSLAHHPLFQVTLTWQNTPRGERLDVPGLAGEELEGPAQTTAKFDLSLSLSERNGRIRGSVTYATALFERDTVERYVAYLRRVLEGMVADDGVPVERLPLMPASERARLVEEWNRTGAPYPDASCVHHLFEAQVERAPHAEALVFEGERLGYGELNARANRLAHHLRSLGVGPDVRVAICVERSLEMVVGMLAVLKAGGGYVALAPDYPAERLAYMLADSAPAAVLTQAALRDRVGRVDVPVLELDAASPAWADRSAANPERGALAPDHLAYVTYTSGSTGRPKGVMNPHRASVNRLAWMQERHRLEPGEGVLQNSSFGFDASVFEILWPLAAGGRVVLPRPEGHRDPDYLIRVIGGEGVSTAYFVCSMLQLFLEYEGAEHCTGLTRILCGGEALSAALAQRVRERLPRVRLHNLYGPTESAVSVSGQVAAVEAEAATVPIGRPVPNVRVYLLSAAGEPVPVGVAGELHVAGAQLARGYLGRPDQTAERFVADPHGGEPGARLYRTGDLARWRRDGTIEFLGRMDDQVKVRGFRVELGEVEARLVEHADVAEAVVVARQAGPGDTRLVAYWLGEAVEAESLRAHLVEALPEYMVPSAYVRVERWPLSPNGKLDRGALPAPADEAYARRGGYEPPHTDTERALAEIWSEVLGVERVGRWDHFFELGGHSLLAVQVIARMRQRGLHTEVRVLFTTPTLAALAAEVGGESGAVEVPANRVPAGSAAITPEMLPLVDLTQEEIDRVVAAVPGGAANVQDIYPLAPLQEGILFHHLMQREGDPYLLVFLSSFDSRDGLDRYLGAFQSVVDRHDALRTAVMWEGLREPVQVVWRQARLRVEEVALDPADGDVGEQLYARFEPRHHRLDVREAPIMRVYMAHDAEKEQWLLLLVRHHLISDHATQEVFRSEIAAHLSGRADTLAEPPRFRDFVAQARLGVSPEEHRRFFTAMLAGVSEPTAPFGLLDVRGSGAGVEEARLEVDGRLSARLRERARVLGVSAATLCHVAWAQVLARVSGRDDVVFGTVLFGRMLGGEGADRTVGPFINTLPVRVRVGGEGAEASVRETHALLAQLLRHEHASLALAQRCSGVEAPAPLFTSLLNYRHGGGRTRPETPAGAPRAVGGMRVLRGEERTNYPLALSVNDLGEGFRLKAQVMGESLDPARVCDFMHRALEGLVGALEAAPGRPLASIDVLPAGERARVVVEWNRTDVAVPADACVHELFEARAARTPGATAVVFGDGQLTYGELNARANRLAHHLRSLGVGPDVRVGICVERSPEMMVGLLAILKAGGAYVPLDPGYPPERLAYMLADGAPAAVLTQSHLRGRIGDTAVPVLELDAAAPAWQDEAATNPARGALTAEHLVYVIYTSGSTGRPKATAVTHRGVVNLLHWYGAEFGFGDDDHVLVVSSFSFDLTQKNLVGPFARGGQVHLAAEPFDPAGIVRQIERGGITRMNLTPSAFYAVVEADEREVLRNVRTVFLGGEPISVARMRRLEGYPGLRIVNSYGPTECSDVSVFHTIDSDWTPYAESVPTGRPIWNTRTYILDAAGDPAPVGVAGELTIGGRGVGRGYLGRPELTAERFVADPFGGEPGARMYRTGDLARWRSDGVIEFLGRIDHQVKVRGYRVELGEIEARLAEHPGVREAAVMARETAAGDRRLVAYWVGDEVALEEFRAHLAEQLPEFMVPAAFVRLDAMPLTPNGKLDRKALPAPADEAYARRGGEAPVGETETALAAIWSEVLGIERVGRHDNFFELGGHSLLAVQVISRVRQALDVELAMDRVFTRPVLADLAQEIVDAQLARVDPEEMAALVALLRESTVG